MTCYSVIIDSGVLLYYYGVHAYEYFTVLSCLVGLVGLASLDFCYEVK